MDRQRNLGEIHNEYHENVRDWYDVLTFPIPATAGSATHRTNARSEQDVHPFGPCFTSHKAGSLLREFLIPAGNSD